MVYYEWLPDVLPGMTAALVAAAAGFAAQLMRRMSYRIRRLLTTTALGASLFVVAYSYMFDGSRCRGKGDFACVVNANEGMVGLTGIAVAVIGIWSATLIDERASRIEAHGVQRRTAALTEAVIDELIHNLQHLELATAFDEVEDRPIGLAEAPQISVLHTSQLLRCRDSIGEAFDMRLWNALASILRNLDDAQFLLASDQDSSYKLEPYKAIALGTLDALYMMWKRDPGSTGWRILKPGFERIAAAAEAVGRYELVFNTDSLIDDFDRHREISDRGIPVLCWINNEDAAVDAYGFAVAFHEWRVSAR
jgi:hypothetical protein